MARNNRNAKGNVDTVNIINNIDEHDLRCLKCPIIPRNFDQTTEQVAHKSYSSCVVRTTDIIMEAYNIRQVTKNVASPVHNKPVIGLEDRLLLKHCIITENLLTIFFFNLLIAPKCRE